MTKEALIIKERELPPFQCAIAMGSHSVNIFSEYTDFLPYFEGRGINYIPWIPGWRVDHFPTSSDYSIVFLPEETCHFDYNETVKQLTVHGKPEEFYDGQAFAYLGFWLTEAQRQNEGIVTSHAAALVSDNNGLLIFGERGDGKTSVALALGRAYGYKLLANDLAMIGYNSENQGMIYGGTKIFGLLLSAIRGRFPELLYLFPDQSQRSWTTKAFVYPQEIGIEIEDKPQFLSKTFMVHIDSTKTDRLCVYKMDDLWVRNYLYENFSRYLRATALVPFGASSGDFLDYLPSLDTPQFHQNRLQFIKYLINNVGIWNVSSGNLDEIRDFIHQETFRASS